MPPLSLYVHMPWCVRKCPYCDFNSHQIPEKWDEPTYINALLRDFRSEYLFASGRPISSIFIGGGTPSLFSGEAYRVLLEGIREVATITDEAEITLEANPGTVDAQHFIDYRTVGINRISIGVQTFTDKALKKIGRIHDAGDVTRAVVCAKNAGFKNINLDLMFALPEQTLEEALYDVTSAIALEPKHISYYHLTIEPNTAFYSQRPILPKDDLAFEMHQRGRELLAANGYQQYEVSAYAADGARCVHNLNYWTFGDYIGIGAGAHGKMTDPDEKKVTRRAKLRMPKSYLQAPESVANLVEVDRKELRFEFLMNALRLCDGFDESLLKNRVLMDFDDLQPELDSCVQDGLIIISGGTVRCSARGFDFLDNVLERFLE